MTYAYENLTPDRFQQFCQAALLGDFPGLRCYPVGQPDGGRDAIWVARDKDGVKDFFVFQVKFNRNALTEPDRHKWLKGVISTESKKVKTLIPKGATKYFIITNVKGTSHLDVGSIDTVDAALTADLGIEATCWWRDDLDRRVDISDSLKWSYPELISGIDVFRIFILERQEKRADAIRAYITEQFSEDDEVKFKQVELENKLLGLFVDVPAQPSRMRGQEPPTFWHESMAVIGEPITDDDQSESRDTASEQIPLRWRIVDEEGIGSAMLLLDAAFAEYSRRVVLEGAPGQGKSTISQFICQVHRMRILDSKTELEEIPQAYRRTALKIPFRIDLRDFAMWVGGLRRRPEIGESPSVKMPGRDSRRVGC